MSRCPSDGPVLKSILGLYRPAADCLLSLSLSLAVSMVYHFPSAPICFSSSSLPTPTATYLPHLYLPLLSPASISLPRLTLLHLLFLLSLSLSHSYLWPHPAIFPPFFIRPLTMSSHKSLCQLSDGRLSVSLHHSLFFLSLSVQSLIVSLSPGVSPPGS